jgi:hypothetical protein
MNIIYPPSGKRAFPTHNILGENNPMKYLPLLLLFLSCGTHQKEVHASPVFWEILEGYSSAWSKKQIIEKLGEPQEIIKEKNKDLWVYNSPNTNYQIWAVGINPENRVSGRA